MPYDMQQILGEANLAYVSKDLPAALEACMALVAKAPGYSQPFTLMAMIYTEMGERDKALDAHR